MTDTSYPVSTIIGHDFPPAPPLQNLPATHRLQHDGSSLDGAQEDDGQISCICGYLDDDGWTVACDSCNRWQHQLCYYPQYEDRSLPEALQHYCVDCRPQDLDRSRARIRQKVKREEQDALVNGLKRQAPKSHKKKIKEPVYTNGWPLDKSRHDRNSASPRDQPPPAKKPKTSHRASDSVASISAKGHSRKRNASNVNHRRSLSRSPETPLHYYTEEFMRGYLEDQWAITHANLHNSIAVTNALSDWLNAPDDVFVDMHGHEKTKVLMRWDGELEDIPGKAQLDIRDMFDERVKDEENNSPMWKMVTVKDPIAAGAYIGELKGHVGFKEEYKQDLSNRWSLLRHPEPFVFFHPELPIYIDARNEGTELRYVRRSCMPNAKLQILVTDQTDYRFCFTATQQIDPGMEVAVSWDTSDGLPELIHRTQNGISERDMGQLLSWVSTVLANCGPCACNAHDHECLMCRFDRRGKLPDYEDEAQSVKMPKAKRKKAGQHISPLNTHVNSRSGSEALKADLDDEPTDSRSASGSAGRGSASRDLTPNTHYSHTGSMSTAPEASERERKKLAKEEEMFRRQEEERSGKTGKKKRNSAGSTSNTPTATSSKQLSYNGSSRYADAGTSKQTGLPSAKPGKRPKSLNAQTTPPKTITKIVKRPKPDYVNAEVQCDLDKEEAETRAQASPPRRPFLSTTQRLLQRCALNNARRRGPAAVAEAVKLMKIDDKMEVDRGPGRLPPPPREEPEPMLRPDTSKDTEMEDTGLDDDDPGISAQVEAVEQSENPSPSSPTVPSHLPKEPPAPPWPSQIAHSTPEAPLPPSQPHKPPEMHIQMPPPSANPFNGLTPLSATSPNSLTGSVTTHSPAALTGPFPMFSPAVTAAVTPSPARKKISLSDYTKQKKAKDKESEAKPERESSPASVASGSTVPGLHPSHSDVSRIMESGSAVEDDVKMEDVGDSSSANKVGTPT